MILCTADFEVFAKSFWCLPYTLYWNIIIFREREHARVTATDLTEQQSSMKINQKNHKI